MDENESMVVDEDMTDTIEETNQDEQETSEVGVEAAEVTEPSETEGAEPSAEAEEESETGQPDSIQAAKRKERERREEAIRKRIERESYQKGIIDAVGGVNPYTNEPIKDALDVEELLLMREIEKNGGDPIADYAKTAKARQREKTAVLEGQTKAAADLNAFRQAHPDVDPSKLFADARFARFAGSRINNGERLSDVYEDFISFTGEVAATVEKKAEIRAANKQAKKNASPGSLTGGGDPAKTSYADMSEEAFEKKLAKVLRGEERI